MSKIYKNTINFIKENYKEIIFLLIFSAICFVKLPYVIETPGGTINLNERIEVENAYEVKGEFGMAYVSALEGRFPLVLLSFIMPNWDLVKESDIKYDNETLEEMYIRDRLLMDQSINSAQIAAFKEANLPIEIKSTTINVVYIDDINKTELKIGDIIKSINETEVDNLDTLKETINKYEAGDIIEISIIRNEEEIKVNSEIYEVEETKLIGVMLIPTYEFETENEVTVNRESGESGPSGGLMNALSIYNYLIPEDITKGRTIIGTGTIDEGGNVGKIGGIKYKLLGADKDKVDIFLCPEENYEEALEVKKEESLDIEIYSVSTLEEAITKLTN